MCGAYRRQGSDADRSRKARISANRKGRYIAVEGSATTLPISALPQKPLWGRWRLWCDFLLRIIHTSRQPTTPRNEINFGTTCRALAIAVYGVPFLRGADRKSFSLKKNQKVASLAISFDFFWTFSEQLAGRWSKERPVLLTSKDRSALQPSYFDNSRFETTEERRPYNSRHNSRHDPNRMQDSHLRRRML
jgi:hypothetical protein